MKHLVALDKASVIGETCLRGTNDGLDLAGNPMLVCTSIDPTGPYMALTRQSLKEGQSGQSLLVPHQAVAYVVNFAKDEQLPFGFANRQD